MEEQVSKPIMINPMETCPKEMSSRGMVAPTLLTMVARRYRSSPIEDRN
jgi:hypothetical protein